MILITGGTGHIGNVLTRDLVKMGKRIRVLALPGEDLSPLNGLDVEVFTGDVLDSQSLAIAFEGVQDAFHLAGLITIMPGEDSLVYRVNVEGTRNVLEAAVQAGVRRLVYTSSIHAIRRVPHGVMIDETIPFDPSNPVGIYDRSKAEATLEVLQAVQQGLDAVIVCPTGVIGPYDYRGSEMGEVILGYVDSRSQLYVEGAYDFVDVRDVSKGMLLAYERGKKGECYILSGEQITVEQLLDLVQEVTGSRSPRLKIPFWLARFVTLFTPTYYRWSKKKPRITPYSLETLNSNSVISHAKATRELGYIPRSLRESLADTVHWLTEHKHVQFQMVKHEK